MFHLTLFGGTEGEIAPSGFTALTLFGGSELRRPTLASQLLHLKNRREHKRRSWQRLLGSDQNLILTLFGGTVIVVPTMVEEYTALAAVLRSGTVSRDEFTALLQQLTTGGQRGLSRTMTLFGVCVVRHPSPAKERKALEVAAKTGAVTAKARESLETIIGAPPESRAGSLGKLVVSPA